ncbi:hypothetical protein [Burkholderia sp. KJ006]|uniref:hypothetical protein n=1 Tax=Burkholderia sp. KJ006 TaxID=416344 RepID=UPI0011D18CA5|nr:hypothetical protein [Burkholderia sp. KJ006]
MTEHLIQTPRELHPELEAAATRYAAMSPSDFAGDTLRVTVTKLRSLGMVSTETWAQVPAGGSVRVKREPAGVLVAKVMLPWQRSMGVLVRTVGDPTEWTPSYFTNAAGETRWSGKHVSELTAVDLVVILDFCVNEGGRVGWNDANNGNIDASRSNPFHPQLLGGYPHREWLESYSRGANEQSQRVDER